MAGGNCKNLSARVATMPRRELIKLLKGMNCTFEMDFTDAFLNSLTMDRLRHVCLSALMHSRSLSAKTT